MRKKLLALFLVACLSMGVSGTLAAEIERNETVYVNLANNGEVQDIRVVNWLRGTGGQSEWIDYGTYQTVENTTSNVQPEIAQGMIKWPAESLQGSGLFYQGQTEKQLPFRINISYWLDGKRVKASELAGQSGKLTVKVSAKNLLRQERNLEYIASRGAVKQSKTVLYTPLMMQIGMNLPVSIWSEIDAPEANLVMVGDKLKLNWALFPYPDAEVTLTMQGKRMELEPMEISVMPMMPPIPEVEGAAQVTELVQGIEQLDAALEKLAGAAGSLLQGQTEMASGGTELFGGLGQVAEGLQATQAGADALAAGLEQLSASHAQLIEGSQLLLATGDPRLAALAKAIQAEQAALQQLSQSGQQLASGLAASSGALGSIAAQSSGMSSGFEQILAGQGALASGLEALRAEGISPMRQGALAQYEALGKGLATKQELESLVQAQHSFIDSKNQIGQVQFLLRTEGVTLPVEPKEVDLPTAKLTLWQRIVNFFTGKRG